MRARATAVALLSLAVMAPERARAQAPDRKACIAAADEGQKLRDDGKLTAAREKFITCAAKGCPAVIAKECTQWLEDAERETPSVTFRALDEQGKELLDVQVSVDGAVVAQSIEARAIPLDPGEHVLRFERRDGTSVEGKVLLRPGEKNRILELAFQPAAAPAAPEPPPPPGPAPAPARKLQIPLLGWVGAGVAVAGGVTAAVFAISANDDKSRLRSTCAPACPESERDAIDTKILLANVGLGLGVAGLGLAAVTTVLANTGSSAEKKTGKTSGLLLGVAPGGLSLRGAF